jgi:TM2 domain-containing membrane protein YozV
VYCRNCGKDVHPQAVACPGCGVPPLVEAKFCQSCGKPTQPNQVLCTQCGAALVARGSGGAGAANSKKVAAGLLALLLNCLGVHKFYLGYTAEGVIMLVVSVAGGILLCGMPTIVFSVIGIVEGVIYLTKSDDEFERIYIQGRRGWF